MDLTPAAVIAAVAAALMYLAKSIYELVRQRRRDESGTPEGNLALADRVSRVLEKHAESEERVLAKLLDLESSETLSLSRIEMHLVALTDNLNQQGARMDATAREAARAAEAASSAAAAAASAVTERRETERRETERRETERRETERRETERRETERRETPRKR